MTEKIGFVGVGRMGANMARRLKDAGYPVAAVYDVRAESARAVAQELGVKPGVLVHPMRLACCGNTAGPSLYHLIAILGKGRALQRLDRALAQITC